MSDDDQKWDTTITVTSPVELKRIASDLIGEWPDHQHNFEIDTSNMTISIHDISLDCVIESYVKVHGPSMRTFLEAKIAEQAARQTKEAADEDLRRQEEAEGD